MVYGERLFVFSGEFHPYRLAVPDLWLDIFQKIKALGFNVVSFYVHWALLEGQPGTYLADGIFAFEPFFEAAQQAGIYLIARPGPVGLSIHEIASLILYSISMPNPAEVDFQAGFSVSKVNFEPEHLIIWLLQITMSQILAQPSRRHKLQMEALSYLSNQRMNTQDQVGLLLEAFLIPSILPMSRSNTGMLGLWFLSSVMTLVGWFRLVKFTMLICLGAQGLFAPGEVVDGTTEGDVDIYGHDAYPLGFDCADPYTWPAGSIPTYYHGSHEQQSPSTLYSLDEFQGGSFDPWGGLVCSFISNIVEKRLQTNIMQGFDQCAILLNMEFERVFYKNNFASGAALLSIYMICKLYYNKCQLCALRLTFQRRRNQLGKPRTFR